jgi:PAS domain S-box-containing protein
LEIPQSPSLESSTAKTAALSVLLVEDDADARANLSDILELDGHTVTAVGSLAAARKTTFGNDPAASPYDVVILDRKLPDGNADEILPELVRLWPKSEIIVVTGFAELDSTIAAFRFGVADYILKPINPDALRQSLGRVSNRIKIEGALKQEQQFADLILKTADAVVLVLGLDGCVIQFNPFFERMTGWKLSQAVGKDWFDYFIAEEQRDQVREVFMQTAMRPATTSNVNSIKTRDGQLRHLRWSNTSLKNEHKEPTSILAVGIDITDMLAAQNKSLQSERLAAIGKTMAALAHESRNALQRIQAGLEMLELEIPDTPDAQKDLGSIRRATTDLQGVLEEVRSFAAPILLHIENANLQQVWQRAWRQLQQATGVENAVFIAPTEALDMTLPIDVMRIEQVFRNLFENAIAATCIAEGATQPEIHLRCFREPTGDIKIEISDSGPGFQTANQQQIFEPFYTTKPTGTGLGLAIVARIVEAHRGTIVAKPAAPEFGGGACFEISLPTDLPRSSAPRDFHP